MNSHDIIRNTLTATKNNIINTATDFATSTIRDFTKDMCRTIKSAIKTNLYPSVILEIPSDKEAFLAKSIIKMCPDASGYLDESGKLKKSKIIVSQIKNLPAIAIIKTPKMESKYDHAFSITIIGHKPYSLLQKFNRTYKTINSSYECSDIGINTLILKEENKTKTWDITYQSLSTKSIKDIFTDANLEHLTNHLIKWNASQHLYEQLNIIHKTGILLYGDPGTGKTTLAKAIAKELNAPIYVINMGEFNEEQIDAIRNDIIDAYEDKTVILIFEDIDCIFSTRDDLKTEKQKQAAQLLLQFLDGTFSIPNVISIATTNHIEVLDPALIREGRFDIKIEMKNISRESAVRLCRHFNVDSNDIPELLENEQFPINPSYIQNKILKYLLEKLQSEYTTT